MAVIFCGIVLFTVDDYGITWDEGVYFLSGSSYLNWLKNPSIETIDNYWGFRAISNEHPPLCALLGGATRYLLHDKLNLLNEISSFRLSTLFFTFFLTLALFSFVSRLWGREIAFIVSLLFFFLPRIFFHAHLAALDYPMTAMWFLVVYAYWRGMNDQKWIYYSSVLLGFALLTKINAYFLYIPIIFYWALCSNQEIRNFILRKGKVGLREISRIFSKIIPIIIISPLVFIAFWPYLWKSPFSRILSYPFITYKISHGNYTYYFGCVSSHTPWHYPFVLTLITIPVVTLIPFFIGLFKAPNRLYRNTKIFILFNCLFLLLLIAIPVSPKYDGVRLFLPAFPFICMISGLGLKWLFDLADKYKLRKAAFLIYMSLFLLSFYNSIIKYHPYQSSYFNEIIGGVDGAERSGFEVAYWGNAYIGSLPFLNEHSDSTFWVYHHPARYRFYDRAGLLKKNIKFGHRDDSDYLILLIRQGSFKKEIWEYYMHKKPVFSVRVSKTNLLNIYKLR